MAESALNKHIGIYFLALLLGSGSAAEAATFCATTGNQLNQALDTAGTNL